MLRHRFGWTRMSMSAALAYRPDRSQAALVFQTKHGSYNTASLIAFLADLHDHLGGDPVTLIWDGLSAHRSKDMKAWLATQRHWLRVERLPAYPETIDEADTAAQTGLDRIGSSYQLCFAFLDHTGLHL
ncbi:transposase [Saccharopolyspora shandongensis]|uniref:transposase n=1 Tax=Saccharopolyspora shandongensis TaxID=418495 RepID=UPI0033D7D19C